jgi:hypothetical protein
VFGGVLVWVLFFALVRCLRVFCLVLPLPPPPPPPPPPPLFNAPATTEIYTDDYTLSLPDALPILAHHVALRTTGTAR